MPKSRVVPLSSSPGQGTGKTREAWGIPYPFWIMWSITAGLDLIALVCGWVTAHREHLNLSETLFPGLHRFSDLLGFYRRIGSYGSSAFFSTDVVSDLFNYPALLAFPLHWLFANHTPLQRYALCFAVYVVVLTATGTVLLRKTRLPLLAALLIPAFLVFSNYSVALLFFTFNLELFVWCVVTFGIACYCLGQRWLASAAFGVAAALKYYPFAFLGLFPLRKDWPKIACGVVSALLANLIGLKLMGPSVHEARLGLAASRAIFTDEFASAWRPLENTYNHSLFGLAKAVVFFTFHTVPPWLFPVYMAVVAIAACLIYLLYIQHRPFAQRLMSVAVMAVWLMPISQDYTLVQLLVPTFVLLVLTVRDGRVHGLSYGWPFRTALLALGMLFGALSFLQMGATGFGGYTKAVLLGIILVCSLRRDFLPGSVSGTFNEAGV